MPRSPTKPKKIPKPTVETNNFDQKTQDNLLKNLEEIHLPAFKIDTDEGVMAAKEFFDEWGLVIVYPHKDEEERKWFKDKMITESWNTVMENQAMTPRYASRITKITDAESLKAFSGDLPQSLKKEQDDTFGELPFPHSAFGGPCMNAIWVMSCTWWMRQHERLALLAGKILNTDDPKCALDRCSIKLPGKGDSEWIHKDQNKDLEKPTNSEIQGKYCTTKGSFVCVPGSHKQHEEMYSTYAPHYKKTKSAKWAILPDKPDPLNLFGRVKKVIVPEGAVVFWSSSLVHGVCKNRGKSILFGLYIGYLKDCERPGYYEKTQGTHEIDDRFRVWSRGVKPMLHPSLDEVHLYPKRWMNFHKILGGYIASRMNPYSTQYDYSLRKLQRDGPETWVPHLVENDPENYTPEPLSRRGKELLVGKARVHQFFPTEDADAME